MAARLTQGSGIVPIVGKLVAARMPQRVRMQLERYPGGFAEPLDEMVEAAGAHWSELREEGVSLGRAFTAELALGGNHSRTCTPGRHLIVRAELNEGRLAFEEGFTCEGKVCCSRHLLSFWRLALWLRLHRGRCHPRQISTILNRQSRDRRTPWDKEA
jgi:hypothetical protein